VRKYLQPTSVPQAVASALAQLLLELDRDRQEAEYLGPLIKACPTLMSVEMLRTGAAVDL
jgi:hypothetical protein